ncbi:MAG: DUF302 domain-containing protein [Gammaproteobacteria bacterium]|nr:DUF302 domain-containing protein [Gammaproteobacteria bacterium]
MNLFKNIFALFGVIVFLVGSAFYIKFQSELSQFDPDAAETFTNMFNGILETRNAAEATVWKFPVNEDLTAEEVEETMKFVANEHNMSNVGELPLSKDIGAKTGKDFRFVKIFLFCNSLTAAQMLDYSDAYSAYLPCRITLIEDKQGKLWLYTLNMDMMIHGGKSLPPALKEEAMNVKRIILDIVKRGAEGDF